MSKPIPSKIVSPEQGTWLSWLGRRVRYLALSDDTESSYCASVERLQPGQATLPHRHFFHEAFYVVSGTIAFKAGDRTGTLSAGGFLSIAGGTPHSIENHGPEPAEMFIMATPSGFDRYQLEFGIPVSGSDGPLKPPTIEEHELLIRSGADFGVDYDLVDDGLVTENDVVVRESGDGPIYGVVGDRYTILASGDDTAGRFAFIDALIPPGGGPPPHIQTHEHEGFFVLDGELSFQADGSTFVAKPGSFLNIPPGVVHNFKNETDKPVRQLIMVAPSGLEKLFAEIGFAISDRTAPTPPPSLVQVEALIAAAPRYGIEMRLPQP